MEYSGVVAPIPRADRSTIPKSSQPSATAVSPPGSPASGLPAAPMSHQADASFISLGTEASSTASKEPPKLLNETARGLKR